jgi:hypothetical protein
MLETDPCLPICVVAICSVMVSSLGLLGRLNRPATEASLCGLEDEGEEGVSGDAEPGVLGPDVVDMFSLVMDSVCCYCLVCSMPTARGVFEAEIRSGYLPKGRWQVDALHAASAAG